VVDLKKGGALGEINGQVNSFAEVGISLPLGSISATE